jgi:predicted transcriptional regulator
MANCSFTKPGGDAVADRIVVALEEEPDGLTRTDLFHLFGRHRSRDRIDEALSLLELLGRVRREKVETGGRPAERWLLK